MIKQLRDNMARFLKLPISRPSESGPRTKADVKMA